VVPANHDRNTHAPYKKVTPFDFGEIFNCWPVQYDAEEFAGKQNRANPNDQFGRDRGLGVGDDRTMLRRASNVPNCLVSVNNF
jgi:hypothetical protein